MRMLPDFLTDELHQLIVQSALGAHCFDNLLVSGSFTVKGSYPFKSSYTVYGRYSVCDSFPSMTSFS